MKFEPILADKQKLLSFSVLKVFSKMKMSDYWFASGTPTLLFESLTRFKTQIYDIDNTPILPVWLSHTKVLQSGYRYIRTWEEPLSVIISI